MNDNQTPAVYAAIDKVKSELAKEGIAKDRRNQQQGFSFRGIDDIYNHLCALTAEHGITIFPRMLGRDVQERTTAKGGVLFYVTVDAEFDFVCSTDGSKHTVKTYGEAMDSGDKATNKAMSAAYKYACLQTFCIPTEGDNDADATTHEVAARNGNPQQNGSAKKTPEETMRLARISIKNAADVETLVKIKAHAEIKHKEKAIDQQQLAELTAIISSAIRVKVAEVVPSLSDMDKIAKAQKRVNELLSHGDLNDDDANELTEFIARRSLELQQSQPQTAEV